jgi:hypothetical protein
VLNQKVGYAFYVIEIEYRDAVPLELFGGKVARQGYQAVIG